MTVVFREATEADVPAVLALLRDDKLGVTRESNSADAYLPTFREIAADPNNAVIVGELDGAVIATYHLTFIAGLSLRATRRAQMEAVRVASHMRGQRVGEAMFADAEARSRAAGCKLMQLTMNKGRTDSARFYQRLGFTPSHIGYKRDLT
ncbi:GNAT family N-acetyltransferase [Tateyamaria omphalii]|uniref:GNAT family N-acetyltransferase n=1 Tax=Tateyamaria omphalii TaxID=299262 RepID=A0A1P8MS95_9RHOB|nr:GNAT family N-acetyltransferase [Tateyamaria omphalii]APX10863.1 GNAT family N-acetyltransferase [Tateyamaria omphalii]